MRSRRARVWLVFFFLLLAWPPAALAQRAAPGDGTAEARERTARAQQGIHWMDQEIARLLADSGRTRDGAPPAPSRQTRQQTAHRAYLEQRTTLLALVRAAESRPTITEAQIAAAGEELERRFDQVRAAFR